MDVIYHEAPRERYIEQIKQVNEMLADQVSKTLRESRFPVVLGGDHSIAIGTVMACREEKHRHNLDGCLGF